jgi:hypothetical protein
LDYNTYIHGTVTGNSLYGYLKQIKMSFLKNGGREGETGSVWGLASVGGGGHRKG